MPKVTVKLTKLERPVMLQFKDEVVVQTTDLIARGLVRKGLCEYASVSPPVGEHDGQMISMTTKGHSWLAKHG